MLAGERPVLSGREGASPEWVELMQACWDQMPGSQQLARVMSWGGRETAENERSGHQVSSTLGEGR